VVLSFASSPLQGLHEAVVRECNEALKLKPDYVKVSIRRAQAFDKLDKQEEALAGGFKFRPFSTPSCFCLFLSCQIRQDR
jgi:hypothetical protein